MRPSAHPASSYLCSQDLSRPELKGGGSGRMVAICGKPSEAFTARRALSVSQ
eukprot:m.713758 g.713758  ORF g.713758 m.713758 type:complete len:52 (-) comp58781_c0_seq46:3271-3426(-)